MEAMKRKYDVLVEQSAEFDVLAKDIHDMAYGPEMTAVAMLALKARVPLTSMDEDPLPELHDLKVEFHRHIDEALAEHRRQKANRSDESLGYDVASVVEHVKTAGVPVDDLRDAAQALRTRLAGEINA